MEHQGDGWDGVGIWNASSVAACLPFSATTARGGLGGRNGRLGWGEEVMATASLLLRLAGVKGRAAALQWVL